MVEELAEKTSNQDVQIVGLRHEIKQLNCHVNETKMHLSQQNLSQQHPLATGGQGGAVMMTSSTEFNPHSTW